MSPGEELIDKLEQLRVRLNSSGVERTAGLASAMGRDCTYYKKSLKRFIDEDFEQLSALSLKIEELFNLIEGP